MKIFFRILILSLLFGCQTQKQPSSEAKGGLKADYKPPECKRFQPAPVTDKWLKNRTPARIVPLLDNKESWEARWNLIKSAKKSIDIQYYILRKDPYAIGLLGLLRKKILNDKIRVRIMVDTRGSTEMIRIAFGKDLLQELASLGAEVKVFNPLFQTRGKLKYMMRNFLRATDSTNLSDFHKKNVGSFITNLATANHDKMILVDERYSLFGGRNISEKYFLDESNSDAVDDADILIDSRKAAQSVKKAFESEFNLGFNGRIKKDFFDFKTRELELDNARKIIEERTKSRTIESFFKGHYSQPKSIAILDNTSILSDLRCQSVTYIAREPSNVQITTSLHHLIATAQSEIWMMNQYFIPTPEFDAALAAAHKNGVKINVITNSLISDTVPVTQIMFQNEWPSYAKKYPNIRFFISNKPSLMHTKMFVFDGQSTVISSYNIDPVSQNINSEIASHIEDVATSEDMIRYMKNYVEKHTVEFRLENGKPIGMEQLYRMYPDAEKTLKTYRFLYPRILPLRDRF